MNTLYIRDETQANAKTSLKPHYGFIRVNRFDSYRAAVLAGQDLAGYANFYVDTGELKAPSREDQLLLEPRKRHYCNKHPKIIEAQQLD